MIEVRAVSYGEDEEYDSCGNTTYAVLKVHGISIPMCSDCLDELSQSMKTFNDTVFCHKCRHFLMSEHGFRYGGSCINRADEAGTVLTKSLAGYLHCVDSMDTCKDASL